MMKDQYFYSDHHNPHAEKQIRTGAGFLHNGCFECSALHQGFCSEFNPVLRQILSDIGTSLFVSEGAVFTHEGDEALYFFNIAKGAVKTYRQLSDGSRQVLGFPGVGRFLGFTDKENYTVSMQALTDTELCRFPRKRLMELKDESLVLSQSIFQIAVNELIEAQRHITLLGCKATLERLAFFILDCCRNTEKAGQSENEVIFAMSRTDMADFLGMTIETLSRSFSRLKQEGVITMPTVTRVIIKDRKKLMQLAGDSFF